MITIREINDSTELAALRPVWDELSAQTPGATFFHSLRWLETYWKHFAAGKRLRVLVVYDAGEAIGIVPLVVGTVRRSEPIRILSYPLNDWGNWYSPIGADQQTALTAALIHVCRNPRDWQVLELSWVDGSADQGRTRLSLQAAGLPANCETQYSRATIDLAAHGTWSGYLATRTKNFRHHLRRNEKKLAQRGTVTYVRHRTDATRGLQTDPRWDLYDACESISAASWQGSARNGTMLNKENFRAFYRDCHLAAVQSGSVDLSVLSVSDRPIAFQYSYQSHGYVCGIKSAYDPAFASEGAGSVMRARMTADCFARGDVEYDLGPEFLDWKRDWLTHMRPVYRYVHFPRRSIVAQLIRGKRAIERGYRRARQEAVKGSGAHFAAHRA